MNRSLLAAAMLMVLNGCASPTIILAPSIPAPDAAASGTASDVRIDVREKASPAAAFEEKRDKPLIGKSESLGVHMSDFYLDSPPSSLIQRLLESNVKAWGHRIVSEKEQAELRALVNRLTLNSRAISAFEFQADGAIDVAVEVLRKDAKPGYRQQYAATCTWRSATSVPGKENMERTFDQCVADLQKRISGDTGLRAALSAGP